jgi:hypothetical protein
MGDCAAIHLSYFDAALRQIVPAVSLSLIVRLLAVAAIEPLLAIGEKPAC